jgi:uridine monophosphate synthetase
MDDAVRMYIELAASLKFDCYADVPTAATPIVAILSHKTRIPMITPRTGQKDRGTGSSIDGVFKKNQVALVVDDLVTYADSKLEAIAVLEANGLIVRDVVVLVDRDQGGSEELIKHGYSCHAAFSLRELIYFYYTYKMINDETYFRTKTYLDSYSFTRQPVQK